MTVTVSFSVTGGQLGRDLADDAEECAEALAAIAENVDHAELIDYIEQWARYAKEHELMYMRQLRDAINEGLIRAEKP